MAADKGYLCDSGAGVACMASSGSQSRTELLDEIEEGIFAMQTTKDPEVRRALQDNLATLKASWADASKSSSTSGAVHFAGNGNTSLSLGTDGKRKDAPAIIVKHFLDRRPRQDSRYGNAYEQFAESRRDRSEYEAEYRHCRARRSQA